MLPNATILFTFHGSHLYGLNHSNSDVDMFRVVASRHRTKHKITGELDYVELGLDKFLENVYSGSHQSCEALFSPHKYVHPHFAPMLENIRVESNDAFAKYRRTIKSFAYGTRKQQRHAVRLGYNLMDLRKYGRFNPQLTPGQLNMVLTLPHLYSGQSLYDIASNL